MIDGNLYENINSEWRMLSELHKKKFNEEMELETFIINLGTVKNAFGENVFSNLSSF